MNINNFNSNEKILQYSEKISYFLNAHKSLINTELDLTNKCNHKCPGCCGNNENNAELDKNQILNIAKNLKQMENKGVILSGGGEPTISPHFEYAILTLKNYGNNLGLNSHGMNLNEKKCEIIAQNCEYFRISLDAGSPILYEKIHGMKEKHFYKTLENIELFANIKSKLNSKTSFGVGFLTSKQTAHEMEDFIKLVKNRGADFAQFRPFIGDSFDISDKLSELKNKYEDSNFKIRASYQKYNAMQNANRNYKKCHGMFFNTVISADAKVWACLHFRQSDAHYLGDLNTQSLESIWKSARMREVYNNINCEHCPILCRNDSFNRVLENLANPIINSEFL